jgi:Na+/proline symporter
MVSSRSSSKRQSEKRSLLIDRVVLAILLLFFLAVYIQIGMYLWTLGWLYASVLISVTVVLLFVEARTRRILSLFRGRLNKRAVDKATLPEALDHD